jgi:hypothetical protein
MKRSIPAFATLLGWTLAAWAASPSPLTDLRTITALSNAEARNHLPVVFEATVSYFPGYERLLFVQDGDAGIDSLSFGTARRNFFRSSLGIAYPATM